MNNEQPCPEGKIRNPKTGRCIKKKTEQPCPEGKIRNPKTGRCIKKKTDIKIKKSIPSMNSQIIDNLKILQEFETINREPFKASAYSKVIDSIELLEYDIKTPEDLKNIKGIGKKIEEKIIEYLETGKMSSVEKAKKDEKYVLGKQILGIYGIGPAKLEDLLSHITRFDELYTEPIHDMLNEKQKIGLDYYNDLQKRIPYAEAKQHNAFIKEMLPKDIIYEMVGSFRRKNETIGDIDILIKQQEGFNLTKFVNELKAKKYILETLANGKNKFMGIVRISPELPARRIDMLVTEPKTYPFALLYFTGSYNFNIHMRRIALKKNLSLSEYGFKNNLTKQFIDTSLIESEKDIFKYLDMKYIPPQKR